MTIRNADRIEVFGGVTCRRAPKNETVLGFRIPSSFCYVVISDFKVGSSHVAHVIVGCVDYGTTRNLKIFRFRVESRADDDAKTSRLS